MSTDTTIPQVSSLEVIQSGSRRRWTAAAKLRIVEESLNGPRLLQPTARRYGLSTGQLYLWRRQAREGKLSCEAAQPGFVQTIVVADQQNENVAAPAASGLAASGLAASGRIEIMIGSGRRMIVEHDVNPALVVEIVRGLERLS